MPENIACSGEGDMERTTSPQPKNGCRRRSHDAEAWNRFLAILNPDRDMAALEYERVRQSFMTFFRARGCCDPEQLADETVDRTVRRIDEVRCLIPFMRGVARHVALEHSKSRQIQPSTDQLKLLSADPVHAEDKMIHEQNLEYLERCLQFLPPGDREFILAYHCYDKKADKIELKKTMARSFGISREGLRSRAYRLRRELARRFRAMCCEGLNSTAQRRGAWRQASC